ENRVSPKSVGALNRLVFFVVMHHPRHSRTPVERSVTRRTRLSAQRNQFSHDPPVECARDLSPGGPIR
ncbi:MAG TPA: hypothetical protein QGF05_14515, partial [Dehalococcoidia bacterium]|nr:hypothetical protein [Dehalococcoidia bacterium]